MREVHSISFNHREVITAILARREPVIEQVPGAAAVSIGFGVDPVGRIDASLVIARGPEAKETLAIDPIELTVAMVEYCMANGVPIKKVSDKWVGLVDNRLSLFVSPLPGAPRGARSYR